MTARNGNRNGFGAIAGGAGALRLAVVAATAAWCILSVGDARAALTCEQVYAAAQTAVRYRDQGQSLSQVLAASKDLDSDKRLTPAEVELLRRALSVAYLGHAAPEEIALECVRAREATKP